MLRQALTNNAWLHSGVQAFIRTAARPSQRQPFASTSCTHTFVSASEAQSDQEKERVALVVGASRGLGLEYVRQIVERGAGDRVIAACRNPDDASALQELQQAHPHKLNLVRIDVTDEESIQKAASNVTGLHQHLDLLINAAGILQTDSMSPETALARIKPQDMLTNYKINAMGPILVAKAFHPLLVKAVSVNGASSERPAVIANMSARVGSIGDNSIGGWHSYRASKTALNQLTKCMSIEFARRKQKIACILLHPGTVDTDLSKPFQKAYDLSRKILNPLPVQNVVPEKLFTKERAVKQLLEIIDQTTMHDNGRYIAWDGQTIPW